MRNIIAARLQTREMLRSHVVHLLAEPAHSRDIAQEVLQFATSVITEDAVDPAEGPRLCSTMENRVRAALGLLAMLGSQSNPCEV